MWRIDAELAREHRSFERLAQLACWVINPWLGQGKSLKAYQLLKGHPPMDMDED